jgi:hypothetical protein
MVVSGSGLLVQIFLYTPLFTINRRDFWVRNSAHVRLCHPYLKGNIELLAFCSEWSVCTKRYILFVGI